MRAVQGEHGPAYQGEDEQQDPASAAVPGQLAGSLDSQLSEALMSIPASWLLSPGLTAPTPCTPSPFTLMDAVTPITFTGISVPSVGLL